MHINRVGELAQIEGRFTSEQYLEILEENKIHSFGRRPASPKNLKTSRPKDLSEIVDTAIFIATPIEVAVS
ncbi:hypothetical protein E2C01_090105 [Portunus trituberculatus]|uniref:Uncharacterized protein n=1 Tax=Portunus trituberculatus TaxID=210409 RepID=A0A5B7JRC0_PORTR|nr:hypothetical protein [Portunus trituberculatus]